MIKRQRCGIMPPDSSFPIPSIDTATHRQNMTPDDPSVIVILFRARRATVDQSMPITPKEL
jgi:hypothetical protein